MQLRCTAPVSGLRFGLQRQGKPELVVVQMLNSSGTEAVFELHNISTIDSGNYSCIYMEQAPPFSGSSSSEPVELRVNGKLKVATRVGGTEGYLRRYQYSCVMICEEPSFPGYTLMKYWALRTLKRPSPNVKHANLVCFPTFELEGHWSNGVQWY